MSENYDLKYARKASHFSPNCSYCNVYRVYVNPFFSHHVIELTQQPLAGLTAYLISGVVVNPIIGKLDNIYGRDEVLVYVMIIYTIAVTFNKFAPNFELFIFFRTIQGIGLWMFPLIFSLIREEPPLYLVPMAQGIVISMSGITLVCSLSLAHLCCKLSCLVFLK